MGQKWRRVNYITNTPEYVFAKEKKHRQSNYNDDDFFRGTKEGNKTYVAMVNCIQRGYDNYITYFNDMKYLYDVLSKIWCPILQFLYLHEKFGHSKLRRLLQHTTRLF